MIPGAAAGAQDSGLLAAAFGAKARAVRHRGITKAAFADLQPESAALAEVAVRDRRAALRTARRGRLPRGILVTFSAFGIRGGLGVF